MHWTNQTQHFPSRASLPFSHNSLSTFASGCRFNFIMANGIMGAWLHAYLASDRGKINGATDGRSNESFTADAITQWVCFDCAHHSEFKGICLVWISALNAMKAQTPRSAQKFISNYGRMLLQPLRKGIMILTKITVMWIYKLGNFWQLSP